MASVKKIPSLRFPGFEGAWEASTLGEVGNTYTGLSGKTKENFGHGDGMFVTYMNVFSNTFSSINQLDKVEISEDEKQNTLKKGDILFTTSSETPHEVGMSSCWNHDLENVYLNSFCFGYRLNKKEDFSPEFIAYNLRNSKTRKKISILAQGSTRFNLSKTELMKMTVGFPSLPEQQKIAACLTAMDDTIEAQQQKVEQLQAYKKGLLQQLFSQTLRFPGFEGEWEEKKLGEISEIYQPKTIAQKDFTKYGFPVYGANGIIGCYSDYNHKTTQIAITCRGNTCGTVNLTKEKSWITGNAMVINTDNYQSLINKHFLNYGLLSSDLKYMITGSGQPQIIREDFCKHKVYLPSLPEQQKIADCLSTLDDVIELETQKLEQLRQYKKGLLQQLFV